MKVIYEDDWGIGIDGQLILYKLPKCPKCESFPTYNMNPCPFCGQELEYPEGVEVEEND